MDEKQPVVWEKNFDCQEKAESFALSRFGWSLEIQISESFAELLLLIVLLQLRNC